MATISIRIGDDLKRHLNQVAEMTGLSPSAIVRDAISDKLEELADFHIVKMRMAKPSKTISNDDVWKDIGIEN
jgi:predicted DNA-binding protein